MRNPDRLDKFYNDICQIHKKFFPDLRFFQFVYNLFGWLIQEKHRDPFFPEEEEALQLIREYASKNAIFYRKEDDNL